MIKENPIYNLHTKKEIIIKYEMIILYNIGLYKKGNNNIKYEIHIKYTIK